MQVQHYEAAQQHQAVTAERMENQTPTPLLSLEELFLALASTEVQPRLGWRRSLVIGALVSAGFLALSVYWHDLRMAQGSYAFLVVCALVVLLVDALLLMPSLLRPAHASIRLLDAQLRVERQVVARISDAPLLDLEALDARLNTDVETRRDRERLLAFGTGAAALVLAMAGAWSPTIENATKDFAMYVNAGLLGMHVGAVAGLAAIGKMRRMRFVLGRAMAAKKAIVLPGSSADCAMDVGGPKPHARHPKTGIEEIRC